MMNEHNKQLVNQHAYMYDQNQAGPNYDIPYHQLEQSTDPGYNEHLMQQKQSLNSQHNQMPSFAGNSLQSGNDQNVQMSMVVSDSMFNNGNNDNTIAQDVAFHNSYSAEHMEE